MGNPLSHPASVYLSCSHSSANVGEVVHLRYKSSLASSDFQSRSIFLEIMTPSGQRLYENVLMETENDGLDVRIPPVLSGTTLTVRIINTAVVEGDGSPKILASLEIVVFKVIIFPTPVTSNGVSLSLQSPPFCDSPQVISITRSGGIRSNDYLEFHVHSSRQSWHWCGGKSAIDFGIRSSTFDEEITVKYFEDGGVFTIGKQIAVMKYTLRNPVEELSLSSLHT